MGLGGGLASNGSPAGVLSPAVVSVGQQTPAYLSPLPSPTANFPGCLDGQICWNGVSFCQDNLTTTVDGKTQYAVWWDDSDHPQIASRSLPNGAWSTSVDLSGTALGVGTIDGHNVLSVAVDSLGYIHISGNMHDVGLIYIRSTNPNSIAAWTTASMSGSNETSVTYPTFVRLPNGTLLFFYRSGASADGDLYLNTYNATTQFWTQIGKLVNGIVSSESPYWNHIAISPSGVIGLSWTWRNELGSASALTDLSYMQSADGGNTWKTAAGAALTLPVSHTSTPSIVVVPFSVGSGYVNCSGADFDSAGRYHQANLRYDTNGNTQIKHTWFDGTTWHDDWATTGLTYAMATSGSTVNQAVSRPSLFCPKTGPNAGGTFIIFRSNFDGRRNSVRCLDVSQGVNAVQAPYPEFSICDIDLVAWEPTFDTQALAIRGELHMLVTPNTAGVSPTVDNWIQWGGVLSIDMKVLYQLTSGGAKVPSIRMVSSCSMVGSAPTVTATSPASVGSAATSIVLPTQQTAFGPGRIAVARWRARMNLVSGSTSATFKLEETDGVTPRQFGSISPTSANIVYNTFWQPLKNFNGNVFSSNGAWLDLYGSSNNAAGTRFTVLTMELGIIDNG